MNIPKPNAINADFHPPIYPCFAYVVDLTHGEWTYVNAKPNWGTLTHWFPEPTVLSGYEEWKSKFPSIDEGTGKDMWRLACVLLHRTDMQNL